MDFSKFKKGTADKPKRKHLDFKDGEEGYDLMVTLSSKLDAEGIKAVFVAGVTNMLETNDDLKEIFD